MFKFKFKFKICDLNTGLVLCRCWGYLVFKFKILNR